MKTVALLIALAFASAAGAQQYPTRLVRIINAQGPGTVDVISRGYAQYLSKLWGHPVVVEQKAGAGSILGADAVAKADPDGHTILVSSSAAYTVNQWVTKNMPYDPGRDLAPVFGMGISSPVLTVSAHVPAKNLAEFIDLVKKSPGKYTFSSAGIGSATHLQIEIIWQEIGGLKLLHVPYKGIADVARALTAGEVDAGLPAAPLILGAVKKGQARILAVIGDERDPSIPEVPTLKEAGFPNSSNSIVWFGYAVPIKTPRSIIERIAASFAEVSKEPEIIGLIRKANFTPMLTGPKEFGELIERERAMVGRVVKTVGIEAQ